MKFKENESKSKLSAGIKAAFKESSLKEVRTYHQSFPQYGITPLISLKGLATALGVEEICVKDESYRFGLNSFKALGGSYAIGKTLQEKLHMKQLTYQLLMEPKYRDEIRKQTFITATDGNHGRGIAWVSNVLGSSAYVLMPKGSAKERLNNIKKENADARITSCNYDDTVRLASHLASEKGWVLVQDTAWSGYEDIPMRIMQGYTTMLQETMEQLKGKLPTHVFVQAGVGSLAAAVAGYFKILYKENAPKIIVVEAEAADCIYQTACSTSGELKKVEGDLKTIMAGLACGEPSTTAWEILKACGDYFLSCMDDIAADGMRILANPLPGDERIFSGESGAASFGALFHLLMDKENQKYRTAMGLDADSRVLVLSTEGITDRENYEKIVWYGA